MSLAAVRLRADAVARLLVHVEGVTEETFVNEVLAERLIALGYQRVGARLLGNARQRDRRGGIRGWATVRRDISRHLLEDAGCIATMMVDYYGLPQSGDKAWPGRAPATALSVPERGPCVEMALLNDLAQHIEGAFDRRRFIPFVIVHEFEGLLFSDCEAFARGIGQSGLAEKLQAIRDQFASPEEINDSSTMAPSKRVEALVAGYSKPLYGNLAALEVGLDSMTADCPHFRDWLTRLEVAASLL